jgi:arsenate reductase
MSVTIYHNPACGMSRNVLAMIRQSGVEPRIVEYLKHPPNKEKLTSLLKRMGVSARAVLRKKGAPYAELGLDDPKWSEAELIGFMLAHPVLIERPIVETPKGVALCRPSERILDLLAPAKVGPLAKEDGEVVIDAKGKRVN